ncbi:MAG: DUF6390 family protein [Chloroflexota bacterium]
MPGAQVAPAPSGPILFARYAFGPNRLGLCGPEDWRALLEFGTAGIRSRGPELTEIERGVRELAKGFGGAFPYLQLIAEANGMSDPLDSRVVDAYWIGNVLSDRVDPVLMARSIETRFRSRVRPEAWRWLTTKPAAGARPTHAFHVLDIFPRLGLMTGGKVDDTLKLMDACRIRWGTVLEIVGERLVVESVPLQLSKGRLVLGQPKVESVRRWLDGAGFVRDVAVGDAVSLHWDWVCEMLTQERFKALKVRTRWQLRIANQTI